MPRYEADLLSAIGLHAGGAVQMRNPAYRHYDDPLRIQNLYAIGIALHHWVQRFDSYSLTILAASGMNSISLYRTLRCIAKALADNAPEVVVTKAGGPRKTQAWDLDDQIYLATELPAHIDDHFRTTWEPVGPFPDGDVPPDAEWACDWVPPDEPPQPLLLKGLGKPIVAASKSFGWERFDPFALRASYLASAATKQLVMRLDSAGKGGFSRAQIETVIASAAPSEATRGLHAEFISTVQSLAQLAGRSDSGQWIEWTHLSQRLLVIYADWIKNCYGLLLPIGRKGCSRRQSKKNNLRRLAATISQYGTLMRGAVLVPGVAAAFRSLGSIGLEVSDLAKKMNPELPEPDSKEIIRQMRAWDELLVSEESRDRWTHCLGDKAMQCGQIVGLICSAAQEEWAPSKYSDDLKRSSIFWRKNPDNEFTEMRIRMQEAGIAVQAPWAFLDGRSPDSETRNGEADKWLLNPLAQILAPVAE